MGQIMHTKHAQSTRLFKFRSSISASTSVPTSISEPRLTLNGSPGHSMHRQYGMSSLGFLIAVMVALFFVLCSFKMVPVYIQNWSVQSIMANTLEEAQSRTQAFSKSEIKSTLVKRLSINQVASEVADSIDIEKTKTGYIVTANYEIRLPLLANIDVVMKFNDNQIEIARP